MIFDGENRLIILENGENYIDVKKLYKSWKSWSSQMQNIIYPQAFRYVGGDKVNDRTLGLTFILSNGWKIRPYESDHTLTIFGNLFTDDQTNPVTKTLGDYNVLVVMEVSNLIDIVETNGYNTNTNPVTTTNTTTVVAEDEDDDWSITI